MIRHTVVFRLKFPIGSSEEREFLQAAAALALIPGVQKFESLRQISKKNDFDYGLSMEFDSESDYDSYNNHPDHSKFVNDFWVNSVEKFLEIDYKLLR